MIPKCPYCENPAVLVTADEVGAHNDPRKYWRCKPCAAHIPCHTGTENPIGRLANAELREAKRLASIAIRSFQDANALSRSALYTRLAQMLDISPRECDLNQFDVTTCLRVTEALSKRKERAA